MNDGDFYIYILGLIRVDPIRGKLIKIRVVWLTREFAEQFLDLLVAAGALKINLQHHYRNLFVTPRDEDDDDDDDDGQ